MDEMIVRGWSFSEGFHLISKDTGLEPNLKVCLFGKMSRFYSSDSTFQKTFARLGFNVWNFHADIDSTK